MSCAPIEGPSPPLARSTHCRPQRPKGSIVDGETRTGASGSRRGRSSLTPRSAHHCAGSAPGTPSRASRASVVTASPADVGVGVEERAPQLGDEAREGQRPRHVGEGTRLGPRVDDVEVGRGLLVLAAHGRDDEPSRPPGSPRRGTAASRRGAPGPGPPAGSVGRPVTTSTRSLEPRSEPRSRRSGQTPSCTPATTTRSHSRPAAAAGRHQRDRLARRARARRGCRRRRPGPSTWSRKSAGPDAGSRSTKRAAASNSPSTASRSRSARPPAGPPPSAVSRQAGGEPARAPHGPQHLLDARRPPAGRRPRRRAPGAPAGPGPPRVRPGRGRTARAPPRRGARRSAGRPPSSSSTRRSDAAQPAQAARHPRRRPGSRARRRRPAGSSCLGTLDDVDRAAQEGEERPHRRLVAHREVGGRGVDGHAGAAQHPAQGRRARAAADDDGHPGPRGAAEQVRLAQAGPRRSAASWATVRSRCASTTAPDAGRVHRGRRAVGRRAHDPDVRRRPGPRRPRPRRRSGGCGRGARVRADGQPCTNRRGSAPRKVCVAASGSPTQDERHRTAARDDLEQAPRGRGELLGVVDDDEPQAGPEPVEGVGSSSRWSAAAPRIHAGS